LKVAVIVVSAFNTTVHVFPETELQPEDQLPNVELPVGVAVSVTEVPLAKLALHADGQLMPAGELLTVPVPAPAKVTVSIGEPPGPEPVKQTTFACIVPVTMAPDEDRLPALLFVFTVAEIRVPPQELPVAVIRPVELTVTMSGVFEAHVTWLVMSFWTGG